MSELRAYFERWQRLEDERQALGDDLKELFSEAKGNGFAPKAMRIAFRSIVAAENESDGDRETAAQVELYVNEITGPRAHPAPAHTREITEQPETANEDQSDEGRASEDERLDGVDARSVETQTASTLHRDRDAGRNPVLGSGPEYAVVGAVGDQPPVTHSQPLRKTAADYRTQEGAGQ